MKKIESKAIIEAVSKMCIDACTEIDESILDVLSQKKELEENPVGKHVIVQIIDNDLLAQKIKSPMCQDTGITVVFVEIGNEVVLTDDIESIINEGVRQGYTKGYLRKSVVSDPLLRVNTKDNTPAIIHIKHTMGDRLKITVAPKGAGSENMSGLTMLKPSDGIDGVKKFVIDTIFKSGGNACPPLIVGVGIGGNFEKCALLAKEALIRDINDTNNQKHLEKLELELLEEINKLGIGPMGFGGSTTALAVKVETYPCHIASLPVAVNIQCHASRHKEVIL